MVMDSKTHFMDLNQAVMHPVHLQTVSSWPNQFTFIRLPEECTKFAKWKRWKTQPLRLIQDNLYNFGEKQNLSLNSAGNADNFLSQTAGITARSKPGVQGE